MAVSHVLSDLKRAYEEQISLLTDQAKEVDIIITAARQMGIPPSSSFPPSLPSCFPPSFTPSLPPSSSPSSFSPALTLPITPSFSCPPGKPSPRLILKAHVDAMRSGSVIVDLCADEGGNVEVSKVNEVRETPFPSPFLSDANTVFPRTIGIRIE